MIGLVLALVLGSADACAPVQPAATKEVAAARAYRAAAASELAAGSLETAVTAYRNAVANDPDDAESRAALRRLCAEAPLADPFGRGIELMDAADYRAASDAFHAARAGEVAPSAALLEGVCRFELGDDEAARPLLREAAAYPPHREEAQLYLGLVALRAGDSVEAGALFESAAANPALERAASDLARFARRDGRLVLSFLAESGWDSNVTLAPNGSPLAPNGTPYGPPATDGLYALSGSVLLRPVGNNGPYVRLGGFLQNQLQLDTYNFDGFDVAGGWQFGRGDRAMILEYDYGAREFGGAPYLSAHRLLGSGWLRTGRLLLDATYFVRFESYAATWSPFSGTLQRAEVRASLLASRSVRLGLAYGGARDAADDNVLSFLEHGPRAELRIAVGHALFGADAAVSWRAYDAYDTSLGAQRADTYLDGAAFAEWDVDGRVSLRVSILARHAVSNVPAFEYDRLLPTIGIGYTLGLSP